MIKKRITSISISDNIIDKLNLGLLGLVCILLISVVILSIVKPKSVDGILALSNQSTDILPELKLVKKSVKYYERILGRRALFVAQTGITNKKNEAAVMLDSTASSAELELQGIISGPLGPQAIISNIQTGQSFYCSGGEAIDGFKVKEVLTNKVVLERDGEIFEMKL